MNNIEIYALKQKFIDDAFVATKGSFMQKQRPYVLGIRYNGIQYLIPLSHGGERDPHSFKLGGQNLRFTKSFPLINRNIIKGAYFESSLDKGTYSDLTVNRDRIVKSFYEYMRCSYPGRYSFDHQILIDLQKQCKY